MAYSRFAPKISPARRRVSIILAAIAAAGLTFGIASPASAAFSVYRSCPSGQNVVVWWYAKNTNYPVDLYLANNYTEIFNAVSYTHSYYGKYRNVTTGKRSTYLGFGNVHTLGSTNVERWGTTCSSAI